MVSKMASVLKLGNAIIFGLCFFVLFCLFSLAKILSSYLLWFMFYGCPLLSTLHIFIVLVNSWMFSLGTVSEYFRNPGIFQTFIIKFLPLLIFEGIKICLILGSVYAGFFIQDRKNFKRVSHLYWCDGLSNRKKNISQ